MKHYCSSCKKVVYDEQANTIVDNKCPYCGAPVVSEDKMTYEEARVASKAAHNRDIDAYNKSQNALCYIVIGGTVLIVGILFVFLSLQKKANVVIGINFLSFQFFIAAAGILAGVTLLILGIIFLILALKARKRAKRDIATLATLKEKLR